MSLVVLTHMTGRAEVLALDLVLPLRGPWTARVELGEDAAPNGAVEIAIAREAGEPIAFRGRVRHGGAWQSRAEVVVVGGAGGLGPPAPELPPREYVSGAHPVTAAQLVQDIATAAGEALAAGVVAELDGLTVTRWTRAAAPGARSLGAIAGHWGLGWRVLPDGTLWAGAETWPAVADTELSFVARELPAARAIKVRPDAATLRPGVVLLGRRIDQVIYRAGGDGLSAELSVEGGL